MSLLSLEFLVVLEILLDIFGSGVSETLTVYR